MTEEKINQIIRFIKECWWRVGLLLLLVFCFVLILVYGWPSGDWGLGWGASGAIGTIVVGWAAIQINNTQKNWIEGERNYRKKLIFREIFELCTEMHNLSYLIWNLKERKLDVESDLMVDIDGTIKSFLAIKSSKELYLLSGHLYEALSDYCDMLTSERERIALVRFRRINENEGKQIISSFKLIADRSRALLREFGGDESGLHKFKF